MDPHPPHSAPSAEFHPEPSDLELVQQVQTGKVEAFDLLVEKYKARLYTVVYNMLGNREDADDLSQDIFVRAFKSIGSFQGKSSFYAWLYRIAINTTLNHIKGDKGSEFEFNEWDDELENEPAYLELASRQTAQKEIIRDELQEKLNEALKMLSKEHRAVVVLHDIEGMRYHEIAKVLKCSEATARSRLFYAHQQLQALLENYL